MEQNQVEYLVKERKKLIKNYNEEMKLLEYKIMKFMNSLMEKYASAIELLKSKTKYESISILSYTKEEIDPIIDLYKKIKRRINSLGQEIIKINDKIVSKYFIDKFKEIMENTKDETFSKDEFYDKSFSEGSEAELDFNNLSENLQNNNSLEKTIYMILMKLMLKIILTLLKKIIILILFYHVQFIQIEGQNGHVENIVHINFVENVTI